MRSLSGKPMAGEDQRRQIALLRSQRASATQNQKLSGEVYYRVQCLTTCNPLSSIGFRVWEAGVIKLDIVNAIVQRTNITRTKAEQAVETVFEAMKNALGKGDRIELRRFGVFNVKPRKTGIGRNPRTGQQVNIPPGRAVRFKPGKELQALPATAPKS
jgi:DNA-binding protein HU-beta